MTTDPLYFQYWGKAKPSDDNTADYHLLPYHCLDVAAVASVWWESSPVIRLHFQSLTQGQLSDVHLRAWVLLFVALHDLGKLDIRFQLKAPHVLPKLHPAGYPSDLPNPKLAQSYFHGEMGFYWFVDERKDLSTWFPWLSAVAGHHGEIPFDQTKNYALNSLDVDDEWFEHDKSARQQWIDALGRQFLFPEGLSLRDVPPSLSSVGKEWLAGFCAICDWVGSNENYGFSYCDYLDDLDRYFHSKKAYLESHSVLEQAGLLHSVRPFDGVQALLKADEVPRQLQTLVGGLPSQSCLTVIEAPTGSGKTETALAYAWQLLADGIAESIVFALPTQATANAMLERLEKFAELIFGGETNLVLAHGRARYNDNFRSLLNAAWQSSLQKDEDIRVQCATWLAESRKRVFLGQIGVCTVDQVLLSVLPLRHKFVRGFGVMKSVLIIDEVHAYDQYMYGLLDSVIKQQSLAGGSAILLSATLPCSQRKALVAAWMQQEIEAQPDAPYPLITSVSQKNELHHFSLRDERQWPLPRTVIAVTYSYPDAYPDEEFIRQVVEAAQQGALVGIVCNLVDHAQGLAHALRAVTSLPVDIFHARYRFEDRQQHEQQVIANYGRQAERKQGRILVATQVIEQSLDLDFDWLITQLCPVDLLFQRLGRLHRHQRRRPPGFESPTCTVLLPRQQQYGLHEFIYGNARVLWRTEQLLLSTGKGIEFPQAYRSWIEKVYANDDWENEPESVCMSWEAFRVVEKGKNYWAKQLTDPNRVPVKETDDNVRALTRDGEMSQGVVPCKGRAGVLWDGTEIQALNEFERREKLNLNTVNVPESWRKQGMLPDVAKLGDEEIRWLVMQLGADESWSATLGGGILSYSESFGLERRRNNKLKEC